MDLPRDGEPNWGPPSSLSHGDSLPRPQPAPFIPSSERTAQSSAITSPHQMVYSQQYQYTPQQPSTILPFCAPCYAPTLMPQQVSGGASASVTDIPPPLPVPLLGVNEASSGIPPALKTVAPTSGSTRGNAASPPPASVSSSGGSPDSLISQFAGFSAMHSMGITPTECDKSGLHGPDSGTKKPTSPDKAQVADARAAQHGLTSNHPRLKVEDALGYLDQVKVIFAHKPKVYNDFLDIMKEFKSQSLDTPGVIIRVATLFRGHSNLIVGFNAFLPHGYRIDIDADDIVRVTVPGNQVLTIAEMLPLHPLPPLPESPFVNRSSKSQSPASTMSADSDDEESKLIDDLFRSKMEMSSDDPLFHSDMYVLCSTAMDPPSNGSESGRTSSRASVPSSSKGVEFDYAINYVNKIKARFNEEPQRYKRFLEILHAYQGKIRLSGDRPLDETDVYKEVGRLFGGHPDLMDDFSRFLPNAGAMGGPLTPPPPSSTRTTSPSRSASSSPQLPFVQEPKVQNKRPSKPLTRRKAGQSTQSGRDDYKSGKNSRDAEKKGRNGKGRPKPSEEREGFELTKTVNKRLTKQISREGNGRPSKNEVVDMSTKNWRSSNGPKVAKRPAETQSSGPSSPSKGSKTAPSKDNDENGLAEDSATKISKAKRLAYKPALPVQRRRQKKAALPKRAFQPTRVVSTAEAFNYATLEDFNLMYRIQRAVPVNVWNVLLKMFELYIGRAFTKGKLLEIAEKLLYHKPKLIQEFATLLQTKAVGRGGNDSHLGGTSNKTAILDFEAKRAAQQKARAPETRMAEFDFKAFERYTDSRSYRIRPDVISKRRSSGSTNMDREVLNDRYVSCPMFSEGSQFTISKKNCAEEVMFKCEDEKYEMDMLLAGAEAAIDSMTFMLEKITSCHTDDKNATWEDANLHRRVITKMYAENAPVILNHLTKNPACAIPTVLERLKQKHSQWIRVQNAMGEIWMDHARRNASKIGDYKGTTFKQTDMRFLRSRHLIHEMEKLYSDRLDHQQKIKEQAVNSQKLRPEEEASKILLQLSDGMAPVEEEPHLTVFYPKSRMIIDDVTFFILRFIKQSSAFNQSEKKQMNRFLLEFLFCCLRMPDSSDMRDCFESSDDETDSEGKSPRVRRVSVPRLSSPSSDEDHQGESAYLSAKKKSAKSEGPDDSLNKKHRAKEFPILPLPWPELCQYSGDFKPLDAQVDEDLSTEAKKRERSREGIVRRLASFGDSLPDLESSYVLLYGNAPFFLFIRYHQLLCERFNTLYRSFQSLLTVGTGKQDMPSYIVSKACKPRIDIPVEKFWIVFIDRLLKLMDGNIDPIIYEEEMREIFRKDAYLSFTLDRVIQSVARQLHHVVIQERAKMIRSMWDEARLTGGAGGFVATKAERYDVEKLYETKVSDFLKEQNCFKAVVFNSGRTGLELTDSEEPDDQQPQCRNWKDFIVYHFTNTKLDDSVKQRLLQRIPAFIVRQHRQFLRHRKHGAGEIDEEEEEEDEELALDVSKTFKRELPADFKLDDRSWLMTPSIRKQIAGAEEMSGKPEDKVPHTEWTVYRRDALKIASESHRRASQRRTASFKRYLADVWTKKAQISQEKHKAFLGVMRDNLNRYKMGNSVDPPYFVYHVCKSDESDRLEDLKPFWACDREQDGARPSEREELPGDIAHSDSSHEEEDDNTETDNEQKKKLPRKTLSVG